MFKMAVEVNLTPMQGLKPSAINAITRKAIKAATRPTVKLAKENAKQVRRFGYLGRSISDKIKTYKSAVVCMIGAKTKNKYTNGTYARGKKKGQPRVFWPSKYLHFLESGTKRAGKRPILSFALKATKPAYLVKVQELISQGIAQKLAERG